MAAARRREATPLQSLAGFERSLASEPLARAYLVRGDERWFRTRCVDLLRARCAAKGFEICVHNAERGSADFSRSRLIDDLSGAGLFAAKRLVVVRAPENELKKAEKGTENPVARALLAFLSAATDPGTLLLDANSLRLDNPIAKAIKAAGGPVLSFRKLYDTPPPWQPDPSKTELVQWFLAHARNNGVRLDARQAVWICAATGNDLAALDDQLERLRSSTGVRIEDIVGWVAAIEPWKVADRLVDGPLREALAAIETLFRGGHRDKSGKRTIDANALVTMLVAALVRAVRAGHALAWALERTSDVAAALAGEGIPARGPARERALARSKARPPKLWSLLLDDVLALESHAKGGASLGPNDFVVIALRWQRRAPRRTATPLAH